MTPDDRCADRNAWTESDTLFFMQELDTREFDISWSEKDYTGGTPLGEKQVIEFGKQILKVLTNITMTQGRRCVPLKVCNLAISRCDIYNYIVGTS